MKAVRIVMASVALVLATASAWAQEQRKELRRADLSGAPGMEVILSVSEYKPGESLPVHFHHGIEAGYVLEGGKIQSQGKEVRELATGNPIWALRDAPHGGWTNAGSNVIRLVTVHIVDKGKPLYDRPGK